MNPAVLTGPARFSLVALLLLGAAAHAAEDIERFFGTFAGKGVAYEDGQASERDMSVEIGPAEGPGFVVAWTTVTRRADGSPKRKNYRIRFVPTERKHVYSSAMRTNMFGRAVPMDPLKGEPYVWATLEGDLLKVHVMEITDDFGYEMQVYERRLTKDGMEVKFSRIRDGLRQRDVEASLIRVPG
jgi:hypothetical protein